MSGLQRHAHPVRELQAAGVSRVSRVRLGGRVLSITSMMRPGRALMTTMRVESNTASSIEWVTKMTVLRGLLPEPQQLLVQAVAGDLVERAERLVHQQQLRARSRARAIETRCCMPPDSCQGNFLSKPLRPTSSR